MATTPSVTWSWLDFLRRNIWLKRPPLGPSLAPLLPRDKALGEPGALPSPCCGCTSTAPALRQQQQQCQL
jgi:hypothetical protein